tara:strand:- start:269 stop:964 length:696 start_codon:yes stop_codon:yes gene_type:complete
MDQTLIFTATFNEKENIQELIKQINGISKNLNILIVDDNSPDGTGNVLLDLEKKLKNLKVIIREKKLGLDTAHKLAFDFAKKNNYRFLITLDADLSHEVKEIPVIIDFLKNYEFVIGSRYMPGGKCEMNLHRLLLSKIGNKVISIVLGLNCSEFTSSYRGFDLKKMDKFDMNEVKSKGYSFFTETLFNISKNYQIKQFPIHFKNRVKGKSKIPKIEIFRIIKNLFVMKYLK